jgi:hypothetical protein
MVDIYRGSVWHYQKTPVPCYLMLGRAGRLHREHRFADFYSSVSAGQGKAGGERYTQPNMSEKNERKKMREKR